MEVLKVPSERVSVLLGDKGKIKDLIEKTCSVRLAINYEGEVEISGEVADIYFAKDVVKAIGRGFEPKIALKIFTESYQFFLINLKEHFPSEKAITRVKARVIGENGKTKTEIESATESYLSIYGNTISIISKIDTIEHAKEAVEMLLKGAQHATVYNYLSELRRRLMSERLLGKQL